MHKLVNIINIIFAVLNDRKPFVLRNPKNMQKCFQTKNLAA